MHWTQDPKNKAKLSKVRKAGAKAKRAKKLAQARTTPSGLAARAPKEETALNGPLALVTAHATGYITGWLEAAARSHGLPFAPLADGVAGALRRTARG